MIMIYIRFINVLLVAVIFVQLQGHFGTLNMSIIQTYIGDNNQWNDKLTLNLLQCCNM